MLSKISMKLALEAPPDSKTPVVTLTLGGRGGIQAGAAQDRHPTLSLFQQQEGHVRRFGVT